MTVPALVGLLRPSSENRPDDFVIMVHTHRLDPNNEQKKHNERGGGGEREGGRKEESIDR